MKKLAIVILNWNGIDMLHAYLPSVLRCSQADDTEVIVADNASTDASLSMLAKEFPQVKTIVFDQNYGFAEGYNRALRQIDAEYFLLLNSDVEIRQEGWTRPLINYMDAHPNTAACQPKLLSLKEPEKFEYAGACGGFLDRYGYPFCRGRLFSTVEKDEGQYDTVVPLLWATGAALMVRATDYKEAGGLDRRFFAHQEEIDLCWRLRTRGKDIVCVPESTAYHLGGGSLQMGAPEKTFLNFRNNLFLLYKNLPDDELEKVMRMRWWLDHLAALRCLLSGDFANFKAIRNARHAYEQQKNEFFYERQQNRRLSTNDNPPERMGLSLVWQYYFKHRKTFSALVAKN